ncbi:MAG: MerR family transcriptional regulator [Syntrophales bacterium]|nr:MerR family transcriptional regulator [Syntrophales bacterium]
MKGEREIKIGDLARRVNLSPRTIRYYEEIGLLNSIKRIEGGRRIYTSEDVRRLKLIKRLKTLGLTLAEMQELEAIWSIEKSNDKVLNRLLELLDNHLARIENRIKDLTTLKKEIHEYKERIRTKITEHQSSPGSSRGMTSKLPSEG